jgi:hypothetical protein
MLLPAILVLALQCGQNTMFLSQIAPREAQCNADLLHSMVLSLTIQNEVSKSIQGHIFIDLVS